MRIASALLVLPLLASCATDEVTEVASSVLVNHVGIQGAGACGYASVAAAIAAAGNGDTILLENGQVFYERLGRITKDLTFRAGTAGCGGPSGTSATIDAGSVGRLAEVAADVTFQQLSLLNGKASNGLAGASANAGGNLWITSGTTTLVDVTVFGGVADQPLLLDLAPYGAGIHVASGATLEARGASIISGNSNYGVGAGGVLVETGATAVFDDTTMIGLPPFWGNYADQGPGGLMVQGTVELHDDVAVAGNVSELTGGGMYVWGGTVSLFDTARVANNLAPSGGGIAVIDGTVHTSGTPEIEDNTADHKGGGIYIMSGTLDIDGDARIASNTAGDCGGGIFSDRLSDATTSVYLTSAVVDGNDAGACGGGVAVLGGLFDADSSTVISNNHADTDGGGVYLASTDATHDLLHVTIEDNTANRGGGIVMREGTTGRSEDVTLDENTATTDGGGALVEGAGTAWTLYVSKVTDNSANRGGGVFAAGGTHTFEDVDIRRNAATTEGGGVRVAIGTTLAMTRGAVAANTAGTMGGGFAVPGGLVQLVAIDVLTNTAVTDGGGITIANAGRVEATDVWVHTNSAGGRGGGIAVLSYAANTDPQLVMVGLMQTVESACMYRGTIGFNQYCSDIKSNSANEGAGVYLEDGTALISRTALRQNNAAATASALWMRNVATGAPALSASNVLIVNNGNVANVDSVRVGGGAFVGEAITSADNLGAPFRFTASAPASLLQRSIVWDAASVVNNAATPLGATCTMFRAVTGATLGVNIVFGLDPFFVSTARGNYRLDATSINAIDQCTTGLAFDLDSDPRPVNVRYDRGAFEAQ